MINSIPRSLRILLLVLPALILLLAGCAQPAAPAAPPTTAPPTTTPPAAAAAPSVRISSPTAGATVAAGSVSVTVDVSDFKLQAPGGANAPGTGHLHYYRDVTIPTNPGAGAVTPADANGATYKATAGTTATWDDVAAGSHTFGVQLVNNNHTPFDPPITAEVTVTVGAAAAPAAAPAPSVKISSPTAGATVAAGSVSVTVDVSNFTLQAPGGANAPGTGHLHYYLDVTIPTAPGVAAVTAAGTYKATPGTTATWDNVAAGSHTFGVQLVNNNHTPFDPPITAEVTVTVGAAAAPATTTGPSVTFTSPAAGSTMAPGSVTVAVNVSNFILQAPGGANLAGYGHLHYYFDVAIPTAPGAAAVTAAGTYKATPGTTATWDNVAAGSHTFGVQLVNNDHTPFNPPIMNEVTVTVGDAPAGGGTIPGY